MSNRDPNSGPDDPNRGDSGGPGAGTGADPDAETVADPDPGAANQPWSDGGAVETYTGAAFNPLDPDPAAVRLADVAAGLARTCRFGGHPRQFYSVAHHSIHVSREFDDPRLQAIGLLHDAAEAYVGDLPRPVKRRLDGFQTVEDDVLEAVWTATGVDPPTDREWERVMAADDRLLAYEADELLTDGRWAPDPPDRAYDLHSVPIADVRERFLARAERLLAVD